MSDGIKEKDIQFDGEPPLHFSGDTVLENKAHPVKPLSRRDFLKLGGAALLGMAANRILPKDTPRPSDTLFQDALLAPEKVSGINVYGVTQPIKTGDEINALYTQFDRQFDAKLTPKQLSLNRDEQRDLLPDNKRFIEFVVTKSTYDSFSKRKQETGVNFTEWIKLHAGIMTHMIKSGHPPVEMEMEILRVVVIDDALTTNPSKFGKDTDASYFINNDYRNINGPAYRYVASQKGNNEIELSGIGQYFEDTGYKYRLQLENEVASLISRETIVDFGMIHELSHMVLNLPDEYIYDVQDARFNPMRFKMITGDFVVPEISPYLSLLIRENFRTKVRGYYTDPRGMGIADIGEAGYFDRIPASVTFESTAITNLEIQRTEFDDYDYYFTSGKSRRFGPKTTISPVQGCEFRIPQDIFSAQILPDERNMYSSVFNLTVRLNGKDRTLFIPRAILNISKLSNVDVARYKINFVPGKLETVAMQNLIFKSDVEVESYIKNTKDKGELFATMKIEGTDVWCLWFNR